MQPLTLAGNVNLRTHERLTDVDGIACGGVQDADSECEIFL